MSVVSNHPRSLSKGCATLSSTSQQAFRGADGRNGAAPALIDVRGGVVLNDNRVVILDAGGRQLLFYSADGQFERVVGRPGRGPGEFVQPTWLGRGGRDTLFVWDGSQSRLSVFDPMGTLLLSNPVDGPLGPPAIAGQFADGSFLSVPGSMAFFPPGQEVVRLSEAYGRFDLSSGRTTPVAEGRSEESAVGAHGRYSVPFGKEDMAVVSGDALVVGDTEYPAVRYYDLGGRLRRVVAWVSEPIPVTAQDQLADASYTAAEFPRFAPPPDAVAADFRPRFSSLVVDRVGWLWVRRFAGGWEPPASWLLIDPQGVLRCEVAAPARLRVLEIGDTYLLGLERDEAGEEKLVRFSLARASLKPPPP